VPGPAELRVVHKRHGDRVVLDGADSAWRRLTRSGAAPARKRRPLIFAGLERPTRRDLVGDRALEAWTPALAALRRDRIALVTQATGSSTTCRPARTSPWR
jgi:hypothetical protein